MEEDGIWPLQVLLVLVLNVVPHEQAKARATSLALQAVARRELRVHRGDTGEFMRVSFERRTMLEAVVEAGLSSEFLLITLLRTGARVPGCYGYYSTTSYLARNPSASRNSFS